MPSPFFWVSYRFFTLSFHHKNGLNENTIFMVGEKDFNVPSVGSEQMYQALRSLGIPTQLVVYPGQFHRLTKPSYEVDRYNRYLKWFGKYLQ